MCLTPVAYSVVLVTNFSRRNFERAGRDQPRSTTPQAPALTAGQRSDAYPGDHAIHVDLSCDECLEVGRLDLVDGLTGVPESEDVFLHEAQLGKVRSQGIAVHAERPGEHVV